MKNKKPFKACLGNFAETLMSGPIEKKKKFTEELPSSVDSLNRFAEEQSLKNARPKKKDPKRKGPKS